MSPKTVLSPKTALSEQTALSEKTALSELTAFSHSPPMCADKLVQVFNNLFELEEKTILQGGKVEPFYRANPNGSNIVFFKEDFTASALHEIAHWCLAGAARRLQDDYGYWYEPVRFEMEQSKFEQVEVRPQALEWILTIAAGLPFRVSVDNLELTDYDSSEFRTAVQLQALQFIQAGLPVRARIFADELALETIDYRHPGHYARMPN